MENKHLFLGAGALLAIALAYLIGKRQKKAVEQREIDVTVNLQDEHGQTVVYDPNPLLVRLNKGLITRYYFDFSERCNPIKELYDLDPARFMATVKAYKVKYGVDITIPMKACHVDCNLKTGINSLSYFDLIYQRIHQLQAVTT
ncbi:hypothetical protein [Aureispira sp. CCB-E]|uniref:hypothetical protein n=2 Tax=unclassified Aureispira TaxID=2649989 RepID=UPI002868EC2A|nr:hypothetical protein [Aureispira sp. CCB-E]WMX17041.1 hypothetical protein QP953_11725 [Aureispira sp. CCB-E]